MLGWAKVTESSFPVDVQREMRLRMKGGIRFAGLRYALSRQSLCWWVFPRVM